MRFPLSALVALVLSCCSLLHAAGPTRVGVATVDITPDYPVRLNGFGNRRSESEGITQRIHAKAIAFAHGAEPPAVLLAVDSLGVPDYMTTEVARRLKEKASLDPTRFAVTSSHTHTAPMLTDCCPTIFGTPIPADQQQRIDRYTRELTDHLERVALAALKDLRPGRIEYGIGAAAFAINRRTPGGPVDHDLPLMVVRGDDGKPRAIYVSYACHCVTFGHNKISGDWAGYVQELVQQKYPGVTALTSIGCGADSNPSARSGHNEQRVEVAEAQAKEIAAEVDRLLAGPLTPVEPAIATQYQRINLPFDTHPTRQEWEQRAKLQDATGHHARVQLARLDRGEKLQTHVSYPIQTWTFGDSLAMVFLPGEVVVDYSLRLKREFDRNRLWVNAYANDVPCYIPSERILREGGYEGAGAMIYYDRPTKLATGVEKRIIDEVHRQLPKTYLAPPGTEGVAPKSPTASLQSIRTKPNLKVELVAAEPLIQSPVAIDWAADGTLYVAEMYDYPTGADGNWRPGGRVKALRDTNADGVYDQATVFLDNIPFPTGVTAFGRGVLVCAAPDVLYAEDTDADGTADKVEKRLTGFATDNYQARVNSISLGLDNWLHGANGLLGGTITVPATGQQLDIRNHDFRLHPKSRHLETVTGLTQQGRVRDDFSRWFGCDNSRPLLFYPHDQRYFLRNPHAPAPASIVVPPTTAGDTARIFPASRTLDRFNHPESANTFTSACGLGLYRDTLLGDAYYNNAFTCEPVHNLVHRRVLSADERDHVTGRRAPDEMTSEFLASTDNWFRPVQVRTGPDGAIYVVDMYRFLIEHPRWIPAERLAKLDARAGADLGRIYRIAPASGALRPVRDLTRLSPADLAAALDTPSGTDRDRVHLALLTHADPAPAAPVLEKLATTAKLPHVRLQALCALDGIGRLTPSHLSTALKDSDPHVRRHAIRLTETLTPDAPTMDLLLSLASDPSPAVRRQLAYTLGQFDDPRAGQALAAIARSAMDDAETRAAVLSSAARHCGPVLAAVMSSDHPARAAWLNPLVATAAASDDPQLLASALAAVLPAESADPTPDHFTALAALLDSLDRRKIDLATHPDRARIARVFAAARQSPTEPAIRLLGRPKASAEDIALICKTLSTTSNDALRSAALAALRRQPSPDVATQLLSTWTQTQPATRAQLVDLLLSRDTWTAALLDAIKSRRVGARELSLADRARLSDNADPQIRALATELFPAQPQTARADVLARYQNVASLPANPAAGAELFAKNCAACHALNGTGQPVGPDLANLRAKDHDYLVKNILDPNAIVEPRFVNYTVRLSDGRLVAGVVAAETATSLTLATGTGAAETIARADVKTIRASSASLMPEGLEAALPPQQMADLIAYLKTSAAPPKTFPGNQPALVEAAPADGSLLLPASKAEITGPTAIFEPEFRNVGYWQSPGDAASWALRVARPGRYDVHLDFACAADAAGNHFALTVAGKTLTAPVPATGPDWSRYRQQKVGTVELPAGDHRLTIRPEGALRGAMIDLRTVALTPPGAKPQWAIAAAPPAPPAADELTRDPASVARLILDPARSNQAREAAINANPQFAGELITELTRDLQPGTPEEYRRIPWIWRVSIAAGRRNDAAHLKRVIAASLPEDGQPLHDWQAVVIGGGVINGISQQNVFPGPRIAEILAGDKPLQARWQRALDLASPMADNDKVPAGTRYDALRMLGVEPFDKRGAQLVKYLGKDANPELQMGAVSGLADVDSPEATQALIKALPGLTDHNRKLALDALRRTPERVKAYEKATKAAAAKPTLPPAPDGVSILEDVDYLGPDRTEKLDLYLPARRSPDAKSPAVLIIHGGGWTGGDKAASREFNIGTTLARAGYVCASVNYWLGPDDRWPRNLLDCKNAVRFLRANRDKYAIDPDRIGVIGGSAGGHLALMVAYTTGIPDLTPDSGPYPGVSDRVSCAVNFYGITNLLTRRKTDDQGAPTGEPGKTSALLNASADQDPAAWRHASPVFHVRPNTPPTLIAHGTADTTVDRDQATELAAKLQEANIPHELILLDGIGHTFDLSTWRRKPLPIDMAQKVTTFFNRHLRPNP